MPEKKTRAYTDAKKAANEKWNKAQYNMFVRVPAEWETPIREYAKSHGYSGVATLVKDLLKKELGLVDPVQKQQ